MNVPIYIRSSCAISPQYSFEPAQFLQPVITSDNNKLYVADPDYSKFISPVAIRRMSRLLKMGITSGMQCLQSASITQPDAIITGTGRGSVTDMQTFVKDMVRFEEEALNPTFFIQSTYNSVNGWLALQTKATCYNQTFVHRAFSLELALFDAQLLLQEAEKTQHLLVGCFDELTEEYFFIRNKIDYWKKEPTHSLSLLKKHNTIGSIAGEGAAFFTITNDQQNTICEILSINMLQDAKPEDILNTMASTLSQAGIKQDELDVLLCGFNGDNRYQYLYERVFENISPNTTIGGFKHLCGEYDTASGFALWLATQLFSTQNIPEEVIYQSGQSDKIKTILILNHYISNNTSLMLLRINSQ
ncbi:MAG TPA: beta-ketoacyl synthase chain length factor [Flavipsychrobacter sp.]|nr:beta-ketoacyl synthase chain length factor [Flavipsychrobacter sp.]